MQSRVHPPVGPEPRATGSPANLPRGEPAHPDREARFSTRARQYFKRHRRTITVAIALAALAGFLYVVVPQISGLSGTLRRLRNADPLWIGVAVVFEVGSLAGYTLLFRTVFSCQEENRLGWRESALITLAGTVATKIFAAAGAGGVALTAWALRAAGLSPSEIARRLVAFELLLYSVFATALLVVGVGLRTGVLPGEAPWTLTVVPAILAAGVIVVTLSLRAFPAGLERRITGWQTSSGWSKRMLARLSTAPRTIRDATGIALGLVRSQFGVVGALAYWALDIAALWASLHAFGTPPPLPAVVMAYFIGQLLNVIPIPGGVGGVEGGMIGSLIAFGTAGSLAILGVLAYRLISFWLPTLPGAVAYVRLRGTVARWRET